MKTYITAAAILATSYSAFAADLKPAFSCDQIKDAKVRTACLDSTKAQTSDSTSTQVALSASNPSEAALDSARQALRALKKLDARVSTGISYRDYPAALSDAKFEVGQFLDSRVSREVPTIADAISHALQHFEAAKTLWDFKFVDGGQTWISSVKSDVRSEGFFSQVWYVTIDRKMRPYIDDLSEKYPGITFEPNHPPSIKYAPLPPDYPKNGTVIYIETGVAKIWAAATRDLNDLTAMLR